jgi:hypothetical protein
VVSPIGAPAVRLFESKLFFFSVTIERADRRVTVWPVKYDAADDVDARAQRDRVRRKPLGRVHGVDDIFLIADKSDVQRIARNAVGGACHHGQVS